MAAIIHEVKEKKQGKFASAKILVYNQIMIKKETQKLRILVTILLIAIFLVLSIYFLRQDLPWFKKQTLTSDTNLINQKESLVEIKPEFAFILDDNGQPLTKLELEKEATMEASRAAQNHQLITDDLAQYADGEVLVQFKEKVKLTALQALGVKPEISIFDDLALLLITDQGSVKEKIETLKKTGWFVSVEPNYVYELKTQNESGR